MMIQPCREMLLLKVVIYTMGAFAMIHKHYGAPVIERMQKVGKGGLKPWHFMEATPWPTK